MTSQRSGTFRRVRIGILLVVLVGVAAWGLRTRLHRERRTEWRHSLAVSVVLIGEAPPATVEAWRAQLPALERWITREGTRWRGVDQPLAWFTLYGPVVAPPPVFDPPAGGLLARAEHAWHLSRALSVVDARAGLRRSDVCIYVMLEPGAVATVEGVAEEGGDVGFVRASIDPGDQDLSLAFTAVAHELLHCLGASDKYDEGGHAMVPAGLVEPERSYPQRFAEVMVGEVPIAPGRGRLATSLDEVRIGAETAAELRWSRP